MASKFIAFEGIDGSGKSTVSQIVTDSLKSKYLLKRAMQKKIDTPCKDFFLTAAPGGCDTALALRKLITQSGFKFNIRSELLLFLAGISEQYRAFIKPKLDQGDVVITDRYIGSTIAYQIFGRNELDPMRALELVESFFRNDLEIMTESGVEPYFKNPDIIVYLHVDYEKSIARSKNIAADNTFNHDMAKEFFDRVVSGYKNTTVRKQFFKNTVHLDVFVEDKTAEDVAREVVTALTMFFGDDR